MSSFWDKPSTHNQYFAAFCASLGALSLGATFGWTAPAQVHIVQKSVYGFPVSLDDYTWISAIASAGCCLIAIPTTMLANCMGPKLIMLLMVPPYLAGWALTIFANSVLMLLLARFLQGLCAGCYLVAVPMYCTQIAQTDAKKSLSKFYMAFLALGIVYAYIMGSFDDYRYLNYACGVLPIIFLISFVWMPESPVYYMRKNKKEKAIQSLGWLRGKFYNPYEEYYAIDTEINQQRLAAVSTCSKLLNIIKLKALYICIGLVLFKHFCGSRAIISFNTFILIEDGATIAISHHTGTVIMGICFFIATVISLLECIGYRVQLLWSIFIAILSCSLQAIYIQLKERKEDYLDSLNWLPLVSLCGFIFSFGFCSGFLPHIIVAGIFAKDIQVAAHSIVWTMDGFFAFVSTKTFFFTYDAWGMAETFWTFTVTSVIYLLFVYFLVPESKDMTHSQIEISVHVKPKSFRK